MKVRFEGVELTVTQVGRSVTVSKVVGRDRRQKRNVDILSGRTFELEEPAAIALLSKMRRVADLSMTPCTCDYRHGFSDHAEHCQSVYVADGGCCFDDD